MKFVNRYIVCTVLISLYVITGCKQAPPTKAQNPIAADAKLTTAKFISTLQAMKPEDRQAYCAQHRGLLMQISSGQDEGLKRKMAVLLAPPSQ